MSKGIAVEYLVPGGVLLTDHLHVGTHDDTCSRCRRKIPEDENALMFWTNGGQCLWMFCNRCDWSACEGQRKN